LIKTEDCDDGEEVLVRSPEEGEAEDTNNEVDYSALMSIKRENDCSFY
jgi:hypothetical protein